MEKRNGVEHRVRLYAEENDAYDELWITDSGKYFVRYTYEPGGSWYFVSDPLGYRERDYRCPDHMRFHVCDEKFKELFISSNKPGEGFPCLRELRKTVWKSWVRDHPDLIGENESAILLFHMLTGASPSLLDNWLLEFKDPETYGDAAKGYDENWCLCADVIDEEETAGFQYAGNHYSIRRLKQRHRICGVEWDEYYCAGQYMGFTCDRQAGTMYSSRLAKCLVVSALKKIYPTCRYLFPIDTSHEKAYERKYELARAAELLLDSNYRKSFVDELIQEEERQHTFLSFIKKVE